MDLENSKTNNDGKKSALPKIFKPVRYYVVLFALISPFVVSYSRTIINFAIIDMIDPTIDTAIVSDESVLIEQNSEDQQLIDTDLPIVNTNEDINTVPSYDIDNSCIISDEDREGLKLEATKNNSNNESSNNRTSGNTLKSDGKKFKWDSDLQGNPIESTLTFNEI